MENKTRFLSAITLLLITFALPVEASRQELTIQRQLLKKELGLKTTEVPEEVRMRRLQRLYDTGERTDFIEVPEAHTHHTEHFRIIWGDSYSKTHSIWEDTDNNDIPDYIDFIAEEAEYVWQELIEEGHFRHPRNIRVFYEDIYIANTGLMDPVFTEKPLNLTSEFFGFADNYLQDNVPFLAFNDTLGKEVLQVTLAHEFFHTVQFSYRRTEELASEATELWWYEASAVWIEDMVYDSSNDYYLFLKNWMEVPHHSLFRFDTKHEYGSVLWARHLSENYAAEDDPKGYEMMSAIWEEMERNTLHSGFDNLFQSQTRQPDIKSFPEAYARFATTLIQPAQFYDEGNHYGHAEIARTAKAYPYQMTGTINTSTTPELFGIRITAFEAPSADLHQELVIKFDGADIIENTDIEWHLAVITEDQEGQMGTPQVYRAGDYGYQKIVVPNDGNQSLFYLLQIPFVPDPTKTPWEAEGKNGFKTDKAPFQLGVETDHSPPLSFNVLWQEVKNFRLSTELARTQGGVHLPLKEGWNLLGVPFIDESTPLLEQLSGIRPHMRSIWQWKDHEWRVYSDENSTEELSAELGLELPPIDQVVQEDVAFWIYMNEGVTFYQEPTALESRKLPQEKGWYLLTIPDTVLSHDDLSLPAGHRARVWLWDNTEWEMVEINEQFERMDLPMGTGFWLHIY